MPKARTQQPTQQLTLVGGDAPRHRRDGIGPVVHEPLVAVPEPIIHLLDRRLLEEVGQRGRVAAPKRIELAVRIEVRDAVVADGLEQPESRAGSIAHRHEQRSVDERIE